MYYSSLQVFKSHLWNSPALTNRPSQWRIFQFVYTTVYLAMNTSYWETFLFLKKCIETFWVKFLWMVHWNTFNGKRCINLMDLYAEQGHSQDFCKCGLKKSLFGLRMLRKQLLHSADTGRHGASWAWFKPRFGSQQLILGPNFSLMSCCLLCSLRRATKTAYFPNREWLRGWMDCFCVRNFGWSL